MPVDAGRDRVRVVVTGFGIVSALGPGRTDFESGLFAGRSGIRRIAGFDTDGLTCRFGAELATAFDASAIVRKAELQLYDRTALMTMAAADEALSHAGLTPAAIAPVAGAMMGCALGPSEAIQSTVLRAAERQRLRPTSIVRMMLNGCTAALCARYGLLRASTAHATACAASAHAIAQGVDAVRSGAMEICLAGGADAFPTSSLFAAWDALNVMTPTGRMRPFAHDRDGFVIGEAAAVLVLEREDRARRRGADILAEVAGSGSVSDAPSLTRPTLRGMVGAMRAALADAGMAPAAIGHVNAHATATDLNDALERDAIAAVFGDRTAGLTVSASKTATGHCMGAASAVEAIATILALRRQQAPCAVDLAGGSALANDTPMRVDAALSNSFAFGGHFCSLAFRV